MEFTQIQITKETKEKLKKLKLYKRDTYEEIINRLIKKTGD
jgi:predicted CopG family antitoxin